MLLLPWQLNNPVYIPLTCSFIFGIQIQVQYQSFLVCLVYALYVNHMHHIFCQVTCILKVPYNVKVDAHLFFHLFFIRSRVPHFVVSQQALRHAQSLTCSELLLGLERSLSPPPLSVQVRCSDVETTHTPQVSPCNIF